MKQSGDLLGRVRVASPCSADWEGMEGDERVRFCRQCNLHVYNLAELTRAEAESLVARSEGRLCARLYRRADGTVLTKDCPKGLRAVRLRVARAAGAAFAAALSLFAAAPAGARQNPSGATGDFRLGRVLYAKSYAKVSGVVTDPAGAVVYGAEVRLLNKETGRKLTARTNEEGEFLFAYVPPGKYTFEVSANGFRLFRRQDVRLGAGDTVRLSASLDVAVMGEIVIVGEDDAPPVESNNGVTVFREKAVTGLPRP